MNVPSAALRGRRVTLGVTGSIACYKAIEVASRLTQAGVSVRAVLSESATRFVQPLAFQAVSGQAAFGPEALWSQDAHILHTRLGRETDLLAVVPATAHTLSQLAAGQADSLLLITALAMDSPLLVAPAMDGGMWEDPATQASLKVLRNRGVTVVGPEKGRMASGQVGMGRLAEPAKVEAAIRGLLGRQGDLADRRMTVSAGGTREPIDAVRHIGNRSSGKQGVAIARAARDRGACVTLISAGIGSEDDASQLVRVDTAEQMRQAVLESSADADALIMAAAVADFRPARAAAHKMKKDAGLPQLGLTPCPDILQEVGEMRSEGRGPKVAVGFAAETEDWQRNGRIKLDRKNLDMVVVNDVGRDDIGFESEFNEVWLLHRHGRVESLPRSAKYTLAEEVLDRVSALLRQS